MKTVALAALAALIFFHAEAGYPQPSDELNALRKDIDALQKEVQELKSRLRTPPALPPAAAQPQNLVLSTEGAPFLGEKNAPVTVIEFADYQCPFCARHFREVMPTIVTEYVKTGKVKYVFRDYPLESIHPLAFKAAEAARCAGDQGKFWEMHDRLMANQRTLSLKDLPDHAQAVGLDLAAFQGCLDSGKQESVIRKDLEYGQKAGVRGTPGFFLGLTDPNDSTAKVVEVIPGARHVSGFKQSLDRLLSSQK